MKYKLIILLLLFNRALPGQTPFARGSDYAVFFYVTTFAPGITSLPETELDCKALKAELELNYGFRCELVPNPTQDMIKKTLARYNQTVKANDQVLYFFSMHGYYDKANDLGYLVPADGKPKSEDPYGETFLKYVDLRPYFSGCKAKNILVAIDACYSGSFADIRNKKMPDMPVYEETECLTRLKSSFNYKARQYLTSGNKEERTPAKSAFAARFLETLRKNYSSDKMVFFDDLAYQLGRAGSTNPENGSFAGHEPGSSFVFVRKDACATVSDKDSDGIPDEKDGCPEKWSSNPSGCPDEGGTGNDISADLAAWRKAKEGNSIASFNDYLIRFPKGEFREEAVLRLKDLELKQKTDKDHTAWQIAEEKNSKEGYLDYLAKYPSGLHAAEARKRAEDADKPDFMVLVPGGTFTMGSETGDSDEQPVHKVTISDFYLGKHEVTVADFRAFISATAYKTDAEKGGTSRVYENGQWTDKAGINWRNDPEGKTALDNHPVIHVSWNDATAYCKWLSEKTGKTYRLPTEAEWEYAAGNGTKHTKYSWGDSQPSGKKGGSVADETGAAAYNWTKTTENIFLGYTDGFKATAPVGSFLPNDIGLYDMSGNVWEWCSDWYGSYSSTAQTNPQGASSGSYRVIRGGSWLNSPQHCRVANRGNGAPDYRGGNVGFRLARTK